MRGKFNYYLWLIIVFILQACSAPGPAPVTSRSDEGREKQPAKTLQPAEIESSTSQKPDTYIVKKGDTLYSIAWNYSYDYRDVAAWNNIKSPYLIYPGQKLSMQAQSTKKQQSLTPGPIVRKESKATKSVKPVEIKPQEIQQPAATATKIQSAGKTTASVDPLPTGKISWVWPVLGKLEKSNTPTAKKGIDITGNLGQPVNAAALGDVVYSGSGLLGYGKLIIIKHNNTFLSAYAHNSKLLVKEGDRVKKGQQIAQMGQTRDGRTLLHFEIRKNGKPIDPLQHLPTL